MQARRLAVLTAAVKNLDQALETFRGNFGFPVSRRADDAAGGWRSAFLRIGGAEIELAEAAAGPVADQIASRGEGLCQLELEVSDLEGARRELEAAGVGVTEEAAPNGRRVLRVPAADTHGVPLVLSEMPR